MKLSSYITPSQAAEIRGVTHGRILALLQAKRIPGAVLPFGRWMIPKNFTVTPGTRGPQARAAQERN
jgi:hypothetical protein